MKRFFAGAALTLFILSLVMPILASAADISIFPTGYWGDPPIVDCDGAGCTLCNALDTSQRLIYFGLTLLVFIAVPIAVMYAGFLIMTSVGSSEKVGEARNVLTGTFVGLLLGLGAYFILDQVYKLIIEPTGTAPKQWYSIECSTLQGKINDADKKSSGSGN